MKRGRFGENITNDHKITTLHNGRASEDQDASGKAGSTFSSGKSIPRKSGLLEEASAPAVFDELTVRILRLRQRFPGLAASKRRRVIELILMADEATGNTGLAELVLATDYEGGHG